MSASSVFASRNREIRKSMGMRIMNTVPGKLHCDTQSHVAGFKLLYY
jgi:hypothetical protein